MLGIAEFHQFGMNEVFPQIFLDSISLYSPNSIIFATFFRYKMIPEFYGHVRKLSESEVLGHEHGLERGLEHGLGQELSMSHPWKPI